VPPNTEAPPAGYHYVQTPGGQRIAWMDGDQLPAGWQDLGSVESTLQPAHRSKRTRPIGIILLVAAVPLALIIGIGIGIGAAGANTQTVADANPQVVTSIVYVPSPSPVAVPAPAAPAAPTTPAKAPAATIDDGQWIVGSDFPAGTYETKSDSADCYWDITKSGSNHGDFIDQELGVGHFKVKLKVGEDFTTKRCGTWTKVG
jgi:hypothetical protein